MTRLNRATAIALFAAAAAASPAAAQIDPSDPYGRGAQRGIGQVNDSGQVGTVTLFGHGARTTVVVDMHGVPAGKVESVAIVRTFSCSPPVIGAPAYALSELRGARSETTVDAPVAKLLSGNYGVVVASKEQRSHLFACGHLFT